MQKNTIIFRILTLFLLVGFLASCKKNDEAQPATPEDFAAAKATLDVVAEIEDLNNLTVDFARYNDAKRSGRTAALKESDCGEVSYAYNEADASFSYTVDYGNGVTCDSVLKKGKIVVTFSNVSGGQKATVAFVNYEAAGKKLSGDYTLLASYIEGAIKYDFAFKNAVFTYEDGSKVQWNSAYSMTWKFVSSGNEVETTGGVSGISREGKSFSADLTSPLVVTTACQYGLVSGTYLIKVQGHPNAVYDFGDGTCDNVATLTINGKSETFTLDNDK